jgi:putative restriction endonuclease
VKAVFEISGASRYDDAIAERYHFPKNYLSVAQQCVGDWIIYRETGATGGPPANGLPKAMSAGSKRCGA